MPASVSDLVFDELLSSPVTTMSQVIWAVRSLCDSRQKIVGRCQATRSSYQQNGAVQLSGTRDGLAAMPEAPATRELWVWDV
jgi:hypothetical protein